MLKKLGSIGGSVLRALSASKNSSSEAKDVPIHGG
jgi:hypothetical protein